MLNSAGGTREWTRTVQAFVPGKTCWLRFPCCTGRAQTIDHYWPMKYRPDLVAARGNWRPACLPCNRTRRHTLPQDIPALRAKLEARAAVAARKSKRKALGFFG